MIVPDSPEVGTRRARLRSDVELAARALPTHYPMTTFIAVNPLAGLENMPFEQAVRRAGDLYGIRGTLSEEQFRALYRQGRITDTDIERALARRYPNLADEQPLQLAERAVPAADLLRADLLHGHPTPRTRRQTLTRAEQTAPGVADSVDTQTAKWCAAYFGAAGWSMPGHTRGFHAAWRELVGRDGGLSRATRKTLASTAERPDDAVLAALDALAVAPESHVSYLQAHLTRLPGWAAHINWCAHRQPGIDLVQYLAVRLSYEMALLAEPHRRVTAPVPSMAAPSARERAAHLVACWGLESVTDTQLAAAARILAAMPVASREPLWQHAFEGHYRDGLLAAIGEHRTHTPEHPEIQLVTCIDTRSEGLRRHLEALPGYQTFGFAGFFAVAIRFTDLLGGQPADLCPVLMAPSHDVREETGSGAADVAARHRTGATWLAGAATAFHAAKEDLAAPFTLAEAAGLVAGPVAAAKTLAPNLTGAWRSRVRNLITPATPTVVNVDSIPLEQRALLARAALTTMGLTRRFGTLVVLCAHGSTTENNPYQAALDCGACGGQAGGPNARTAALILNQRDVREQLRDNGIDIPDRTVFIAAQHDTATDRVTILDEHLVPAGHRGEIERLRADLATAGTALATERCADLPGARRGRSSARHVRTRSRDWAQVYPEWGLAGNAAFVVAPRSVTRGIDLRRRAFLHSYDPDTDSGGEALETILTAPLVVAQWINSQYYFSTVAPETFGAGSKTIHNVVGTAGVLSGHTGDLRLGLPWQSVAEGTQLRHEPLRLLAVIQAPLPRIDAIVERNPILLRLFGNEWISVAARDDTDRPWQRWTHGGWRPWSEADRPSEPTHTKEMIR
ncbi:DUF2309 domain-containing protein [Mycobacterium sp. MBM]|nr:DUF2309 domain-containing protein [Mycobacterium sp. MBM]